MIIAVFAAIRELKVAEICNCLGAVARIGYYRPTFVSALVEMSHELIQSASNQELVSIAWACGRLQHVPDTPWLDTYMEETLKR